MIKSSIYPLTTMQRDIYFDVIKNPGKNSARLHFYTILNKKTDPLLWKEAIGLMVKKHPALRTVIYTEDGNIYQCIEPDPKYDLIYEEPDVSSKEIEKIHQKESFLNS